MKLNPSRGLTVPALALLLALAACDKHDPVAVAREYIAKRDYTSAAVHLRAAVQADPASAELRVMLADALERRHELAAVSEALAKAMDNGGDVNTLAPRAALVLLDRNELDELVRTYRELRLTDPSADSSLRGTVALALLGLQREQPARTQVTLATAPAASVGLAKAQLLVSEGKARAALESLDLDGAGRDAPWWVLRAAKRIAVSLNEQALALSYMKRALDLAPWHGGVKGEYGETLVMADKPAEAAVVRDELRKVYPGLFWTHYLDALLLHRAGRFEEAHAASSRALRAAPEHVPAQLMAASAELQKGDLMVAERRLQALLRKNPGSVPAWQLLARVQAGQGRQADMAASLKRGLELAPADPLLLSLKADMQLAAGEFKPALTTLAALQSQRPQDPDVMLRIAQARFRSGDKAGAAALVDGAAAASAANAEAMARVVAMALRLNNPTQARKFAEQIVASKPDDAYAHLSLGAVQSAQSDPAGAWTSTLAALDRKPTHPGALQALAGLARSPEQLQEVFKRHQRAVDEGTKEAQTYLDFASLLRGRPGEKINTPMAVLEKGAQVLPTALPLREALVEQLLRQGETDRAVVAAQTGATMANAPPGTVALLAGTYERLGRAQQAAEVWRKLVADNPQRADWRMRLIRLDAGNGRAAEAASQLKALIGERPFDIQPYLMLAQLLAPSDLNAALGVAQQLGQQPEFKTAGLLLSGDVYAGAGRYGEAIEQYDLAAKAGAGSKAVLRVLQALKASGKADAAERELEAALRKAPDDSLLLAQAAQQAQERGDAGRAVELWQRMASRSPGDPYVLNDLAWAQLLAGRPEALKNAQRAATLLPNNPNALHTLGMALSRSGRKDEAIEALRAAANLAPLSAMPRLHLAQHLAASGDKVGAANALRSIDAERLSAPDKDSLGKLKAELGVT